MTGLRLARHRATTAQLAAAYPFQAEGALGARGVCLGTLSAGGGAFCFDPFDAYTRGLVEGPNMVVAGMPRVGKSTAVKCLLWRAVGALRSPGGLPRWVAVVDPKGEYGPLAAALGLEVIRLHPGGGARLNPLDPGPAAAHGQDVEQARVGRAAMVATLLAAVLRRPLAPVEDAALGWAVEAAWAAAAQPTLVDLARLLAEPPEAMAARARRSPAALAAAVEEVRLGLGKLLDRELRGMFDGASTVPADLGGRGVVVDLSAVHHDPAALGLVMVATTGWLQGAMAAPEGAATPRRLQVVDEAWALLADERSARYLQACFKLCSSYGVANLAVFHRLSDLRAQADDGTATTKITMGLLADADTRVLFRQATDQVPDARELLGLSGAEAAVLPRLAKGQALWKVRERPVLVDHRVGAGEWAFCDTDRRLVV